MEAGGSRRGRHAWPALDEASAPANVLPVAAGFEDADRPHERVGRGERDKYECAGNSRANPRANSRAIPRANWLALGCGTSYANGVGIEKQYHRYAEKPPELYNYFL
jgi:hypothetical protein